MNATTILIVAGIAYLILLVILGFILEKLDISDNRSRIYQIEDDTTHKHPSGEHPAIIEREKLLGKLSIPVALTKGESDLHWYNQLLLQSAGTCNTTNMMIAIKETLKNRTSKVILVIDETIGKDLLFQYNIPKERVILMQPGASLVGYHWPVFIDCTMLKDSILNWMRERPMISKFQN